MKFTKQQNQIWEILFNRQIDNIKNFACKEYILGLEKSKLNKTYIPSIEELNRNIGEKTGWKVERTQIRYLSALQWSNIIGKKVFPVTTYLRSFDEIDFTPEPDMFHDKFGHLPFLLSDKTLTLYNLFAEKMSTADEDTLINILAKLWWFSIEFGLIQENGSIKAFGAGLMSSYGEIVHAISNKSIKKEFRIEEVIKENPAVYSFHDGYFVINSLDYLIDDLRAYFETI